METYYDTLEVAKTATKKEIKKAYYRLAKEYHPDHHKNDEAAVAKFKAVGEAYRVLSDDAARAEYDRKLAEGPAPAKGRPGARPAGGPVQKPKPRTPGASTANLDFQNITDSFAAFYGFDPKSKQVTDEGKLGTYVPKERKKNPLDMTDMFERFMGIKK